MITWLTNSIVTKYFFKTHVPILNIKFYVIKITTKYKEWKKRFFPPLSTQKSKGLPTFLVSTTLDHAYQLKPHWMEMELIKLISNKQAKWLTYRISWCNVRIKLGQSLWAWRAFTKCLPLLDRQRDKSAWWERWSRSLEKTQQSTSEVALQVVFRRINKIL